MNNEKFNPDMLTLGREARGLTQTELAKRMGVTQGKLSKHESSILPVSDEEATRYASVLDFPVSFFYQPDKLAGCGTVCDHFRKRQSLSSTQIRKIQARTNLFRLHVKQLLYRAELDTPLRFHRMDIGDYEGGAEHIAQKVRQSWNLPGGPIRNLVGSIEDTGGIVFKVDFDTPKIDAMSNWPKSLPPLFFVNSENPNDRMRWTLSHEIGHLVMHFVPTNSMEIEADKFAAEFLMPAAEIKSQLSDLRFGRLVSLKEYWKVSMAAIIRRARDLQKIDDSQYRYMMMQMSQRGYRKAEPGEVPGEEPSTFRELIQTHRTHHGYSVSDLANLLRMNESEFRQEYLAETSHFTMRLAN